MDKQGKQRNAVKPATYTVERHKHKHKNMHSPCKHKPRAEQKTKQRKILVVLYLQVPEDK